MKLYSFLPTHQFISHHTMKTSPHPTPTRPAVRRAVHLLLLALTLLVGLGGAHAANGTPPEKMTYQGFLADASGVPLGNVSPANYVTVFRIWPADTGGAPGTALWTEVQTVTIDKGNFSVILGDGLQYAAEAHGALSAVFSSPTGSDRYLEITVTIAGNPVTIAPRLRLVAAPYALLATTATRLVNPDGSTLLNSPSTGAVNINGAVTATSFIGDGTGLTGVLKEGGSISAATINAGNFTVSNKFTAAKIYSAGAMGVGITNVTRGILEVGGVGMLPYQFRLANPITTPGPLQGTVYTIALTNITPKLNEVLSQYGYPTNNNIGWSNNFSGNLFAYSELIDTNSPHTPTQPLVTRTNKAFIDQGILGIDLNFMLASSINGGASGINGLTNVSILGVNAEVTTTTPNPNYSPNYPSGSQYNSTNWLVGAVAYPGERNYYSGAGNYNYNNYSVNFLNYAYYYNINNLGGTPASIPGNTPGTFYPSYGAANQVTNQPTYFSIFADGPVAATLFYALSDARIKKVQGRSDASVDLNTLMDIEVTDYTFKDVLQKGAGKHKKVIAQQVEKIYPQAVSKSTGPVPDIYQQAPVKNGWVYLATDLKAGEKVRLTSEKGDTVHEVLEVRGGSFRVDLPASVEGVFVYGREVNDFRSVDYEALAMLNVSATQELARQVEALRKSEARIAELEQKTSQMGALERKLADLEKLLSQVVAGRKDERPAAEAPAAKSVNNP